MIVISTVFFTVSVFVSNAKWVGLLTWGNIVVCKIGVATTNWGYCKTWECAEAGHERYGNHNGRRYRNEWRLESVQLCFSFLLAYVSTICLVKVIPPFSFHTNRSNLFQTEKPFYLMLVPKLSLVNLKRRGALIHATIMLYLSLFYLSFIETISYHIIMDDLNMDYTNKTSTLVMRNLFVWIFFKLQLIL